jgi:hypothetical protein
MRHLDLSGAHRGILYLMPEARQLPPSLTAKCLQFGIDVCKVYAAGKRPRSSKMDLDGIRFDPIIQGCGKIAECGVALDLGLDPLTAVDWGFDAAPPHDLITRKGNTVDVKSSTHPNAQYLIWPVSKIDIFENAAQYLVLAIGLLDEGAGVYRTLGYVSKEQFRQHHKISDGTERPRLPHVGTWYMRKSTLLPFNARSD